MCQPYNIKLSLGLYLYNYPLNSYLKLLKTVRAPEHAPTENS